MQKQRVALLGLGTMGAGMAANLLKAGFPLTVYNRTREKGLPLEAGGAKIGNTPAETVHDAQVIVSMLADDAASRTAWLGQEGALNAASPGAILIECSTVSPAWIIELAKHAAKAGVELLDAPVTGSRTHAEGGQLNFLVGGSEVTLASVTPVLQAMGKEITHLGTVGSGAKLKLINNFLCGVQAASLAEGLAWLERSGLDIDKSLAILKGGAPGSPLLGALSARMMKHDYTVNFVLKLMSKDLQYAHDEAATIGVDLTTAANAHALFESAAKAGYADQDMSSVVERVRASTQS